MNYLGISNNFHDASISLVDNQGNILFAGHTERYSKLKHDKELNVDILLDALNYKTDKIKVIDYYERPLLTQLRQIRAGQSIDFSSTKQRIGNEIINIIGTDKIRTHNHHLSHAAAGFQTSNFSDATIVVIDAIGEFDTITIWDASYDNNGYAKYKKLYSKKYPNSIGLFYSAMTKHVGLKPLDEEYILMGMVAYGNPIHTDAMINRFLDEDTLDFKENLHAGIEQEFLQDANEMDIASSAQLLTEICIEKIISKANIIGKSSNLVYMGGVALNCLANRLLGKYFNDIWIMPNPGDAGSSLGACALGYGKRLNWQNAFLGKDILAAYPINQIINELETNKIVGVANGRAEFGPRALGNRSLLADPRGNEIKDKVNEIKRRQKFRPFAPVILEEFVNEYFVMPKNWTNSRYMQVIAKCSYPEKFPAITHYDGTSRVQTVPKDNSNIRKLLEAWYEKTNCPMLLNTSLNIRGEPMVNDVEDAKRFESFYKTKVLTGYEN